MPDEIVNVAVAPSSRSVVVNCPLITTEPSSTLAVIAAPATGASLVPETVICICDVSVAPCSSVTVTGIVRTVESPTLR